jgi:uncharacterized protein (TIGR02996 family)
MSAHDDLLAAVAAAPDDDGPRLVMADWFEEHGDPDRAEFIRLQLELAKKDEYDPDFPALTDREHELLREHGHRWKTPELKAVQEFRRGFVDFVWLRGDRILQLSDTIDRTKTITRLRVSGIDRRINDLADLPWANRIRELDLSNNIVVRFLLPDVFENANWSSLSSVIVRNIRLWAEELEVLLLHPSFPRLRHLEVSGNPLGDDGLALLASSPVLAGLEGLIFRSNGLDESESVHARGMASLATSPTLTSVRVLDLAGHNPGGAGLVSLAESPVVVGMQRLGLAAKGYKTDEREWATAFFRALRDRPIRSLTLSGQFTHPTDAAVAARWDGLKRGSFLDIRRMALSADEFATFQSSAHANHILLPEPTDES